MRKLIIICCALFVLAGCGTVAKEVTPQAEPTDATPKSVTTNALIVKKAAVATIATQNILSANIEASANISVEINSSGESTINISAEPVASGNIFISGNTVVIDVSAYQTPVDALLASFTGDAEYEIIPDGVLITVKLASTADTVLSGAGETNQVYLPCATEVFVSVDLAEPTAYAAVETQPVTVIY